MSDESRPPESTEPLTPAGAEPTEPVTPVAPAEPAPVEPSTVVTPTLSAPPPDTGSPGRQLTLAALAFVATLILLFGLASLLRPSPGGAVASSTASGATATSVAGESSASPSSPASSPSRAAPSSTAPSASGTGPSAPASAAVSASGAAPSGMPTGDPVLIGAGDIADCGLDGDSATAALVAANPGAVFTAGDNAYPDGTPAQFHDCYAPTWGRFLDRTRPAAGNHDWVTKDLAGYLGYFGAAAAPNGKSWYSYDLGTWHIVALDSDCGFVGGCVADSEQGRWLAADLKASTARCTLAIWHHPRFSSGEHGNDASSAPFWRALYDAGADVVINGHDHDYEQFKPQDPDGHEDRARGIREFVVGTGGAELRTFRTNAPNSELRIAGYHGVIRLVFHPSSYEWRFIPTTGDIGAAGKASCH
jgi:acid phosphatase type 7